MTEEKTKRVEIHHHYHFHVSPDVLAFMEKMMETMKKTSREAEFHPPPKLAGGSFRFEWGIN